MKKIEWLASKLDNIDLFAYNPEKILIFNKKNSFSTIPGAL